MSFILDALRKSENSRLRQEHPAMFDARAVASRRPFPAWAVALGLLLGLNLLVVLFVLLRQEREVVDTAADKVAVTAAATAPVAPVPPVATAAPVAAAAVEPNTPPAAATASVARADVPPPALPAASPAATPATSVPLPSTRRPVPGTVTRETTVDGVAFDAATPRAPPRTRDDLLAGGDAVPEAALSLHVYDPDPAARFILLNGQRLREGDMAGNGLRVLDIVPDGVVLDHRGNTFKVSIDP
jgi:general secretion pathway protein B